MTAVTLMTDFGLRDHFVAAMKGVMLNITPELTLIDITHEIPRGDIHSGAFTLGQCCFYFPSGTIHLAVVDPGVGSHRKALAVEAGGHFFVAPDNGLLTHVLKAHEDFTAHEITAEQYFLKPVAATFHGRDIFAPVAAWMSRGVPLSQLGPPLPNPVRLPFKEQRREGDSIIHGTVLAVDHFGNLITNLKSSDAPRAFKIVADGRELHTLRRTYTDGAPGEIFVVAGSAGYLEIVMRDGSAAETLRLQVGASVVLISLRKP